MDKFTSIAKGGWHPNKDSRPSYSSDQPKGLRDRAKGLMGKSSDPYEASRNHQSRPLSSLRDPASFAPPPKHYAAHGSGASGSTNAVVPVRSGLGAPLSQAELEASEERQRQIEAAQREEEDAARPPPGPYRVDTTGLSTSHLPPPPVRRPGSETSTPVNSSTPPGSRPALAPPAPSGAKPRLPPRLPPRQNSHPDLYAPAPPPTYQESVKTPPANPESGVLNSGAINRLGKAGVSVPGFNIGRTASPPVPARASPPPRQDQNAPASSAGQLSGLQSRFSSMRLGSSSSSENAPTQGTSFAQKQSAFKTAQAFHKNPSSVSFNDMRSAASTANNFRQRHGNQVAAGVQTANGLNQKYGVLDRVNGIGATPASAPRTSPPPGSTPPASAPPTTGALGKKPPPPPPPKRKDLGGSGGPPPLPLASKPRPGQP